MPSATEEFAALTTDPVFASLHLSPIPLHYQTEGGVMKMIHTTDSMDARIFEVKSPVASNKYVFMVHEWWGLNDYIKREAEKLRKELGNVTVIALDMYDSKVATDPQTAGKYASGLKDSRARTIIQAAIDYVGKDADVATIGWCFGGGWSLQAAFMLGKQAAGCVMYYGMPEKDVEKIKTLHCDVLGIFGTQDGYITPALVEQFQKDMKTAGKNITVYNYDAVHAFANPSNPKYDEKDANDAHVHVLAFLKEKLGV